MVANRSTKYQHLRFSHESDRDGGGVLVFDDIPVGATVHAQVDRPTELDEPSDGGAGAPALQPYTFELAPPPAQYTVAGVVFDRHGGSPPYVPAGAAQSSRQRTLNVLTTGQLQREQHEPTWAAFAVPVVGSLPQKGSLEHTMLMPGAPALVPNLPPEQRNLLRFRWTGTVVGVAVTLEVLAAATQAGLPTWGATGHVDLVPGSIVMSLPTSLTTIRDDGNGRLVGPGGDGTIDYRTGAYQLTFKVAETGNLDAAYEHGCLYQPLDVVLSFDPLQAR